MRWREESQTACGNSDKEISIRKVSPVRTLFGIRVLRLLVSFRKISFVSVDLSINFDVFFINGFLPC